MIKKVTAVSVAFAASCALVACAPAVEEAPATENSEAAAPVTGPEQMRIRDVNTATCRVHVTEKDSHRATYDYGLNHVFIASQAIPFQQIINHAGQARVRAVYDTQLAETSCPAPVFLIEATPPQPATPAAAAPAVSASAPQAPAAAPVAAPAP